MEAVTASPEDTAWPAQPREPFLSLERETDSRCCQAPLREADFSPIAFIPHSSVEGTGNTGEPWSRQENILFL